MDLSQLHFACPWCLWIGAAIPLVWVLYFIFYQTNKPGHQLEKFIDSHLLPYLLVNRSAQKSSLWKSLLMWSFVWAFLTLALAGPRWSYREMEVYSRDQSLVILLDLSESMNATDVKPSRIVRAKQKIEDLLNLAKGVKIGLVAFAADPHMITPITDDKETIRHLLPHLSTDLVHVQGSKLSSALDMAAVMLEAEPGNNKSILIVTDGGFEDASAIATAKKLAEKEVVINVMGMGTSGGAPLLDKDGKIIRHNGVPIVTRLEKEKLSEISKVAHGRYLEAHYSDYDEKVILGDLEKRADAQMEIGKTNRFWDERFYWLIFPVLPIVLLWFRRGYLFAVLLFVISPCLQLEAAYFKNSEEQGKELFGEGNFEEAAAIFHDSYRKGVSHYKAGNFADAEKMFRQSDRPEVAASAAYNLGNSLAWQNKLQEALIAYDEALKHDPDHAKARENRDLVKKMLEEQDDNEQKKDNPNKDESADPSDDDGEKQESDGSGSGDEGDNQDSNGSDDKNPPQDNDQEQEQKQGEPPQNNSDNQNEQQESPEQPEEPPKDPPPLSPQQSDPSKSQADHDADLWLNRMTNDPKLFLKNKFYIESKRNGTTKGVNPW